MEDNGCSPLIHYSDLKAVLDKMYDEIIILDANYRILYINNACARHYGYWPKDMLGRSLLDMMDNGLWGPSIAPIVYQTHKAKAIQQKTFLGIDLTTIATPIFDENGELKYVVMNVRDTINQNDFYKPTAPDEQKFPSLKFDAVYCSDVMKAVYALAQKAGNVDATCILTGESGTGKTMLAKYIHQCGCRSHEPFLAINCASLPGELLESELFGYKKGAFTGANAQGKMGLLEVANHGTILLDEISELALPAQAKLLHVIQDKEFYPIGSTHPIKIDVKIIAATNRNLESMVNAGQFRRDLYYRLNIVEIYIPPLRKRREDIPSLIYHFLAQFNTKYGCNKEVSASTIKLLSDLEWKGNVRELQHLIERLVITTDDLVIEPSALPRSLFELGTQEPSVNLGAYLDGAFFEPSVSLAEDGLVAAMEVYEGKLVRKAYQSAASSRKLAELLKVSQSKANRLIQKYIR